MFQGTDGFFSLSAGGAGVTRARHSTRCVNFAGPLDSLVIPGGSQDGTGATYNRFCGGLLSYTQLAASASPVKSKFVL